MREFKITNYTISEKEALYFAATILLLSFLYSFGDVFNTWREVLANYFDIAVLLGLSFLFHQLVQKSIAQTYGASTRYELWLPGLLIAMTVGALTFGEIIVFAVGVNMIVPYYGSRLSKKAVKLGEDERGKIALSGILSNLALAFIVKLLSPFLAEGLWLTALNINLWIAFYYLIPVPPLNGAYVFMWSRLGWALTFMATVMSLVLMSFLPLPLVLALIIGLGVITFLFMVGFKLV